MSQWTPAAIAGIFTAAAGLIAAVGALYHSWQTRKTVNQSQQAPPQGKP